MPAPLHSGQRPCGLLKENRAGPKPRMRASGTCANSWRMVLKKPTYVAGTERGVRPIGDWSTSCTALICPMPSIFFLRLLFSSACTAGRMHSRTSVLLPEPLTPVTAVNRPSGTARERFFKLFLRNPRKMSDGVLFFRLAPRRARGGVVGRAWPSAWPRECWPANSVPVSDFLFLKICLSEPAATTWPPSMPAPGPRSMM